MERISICPQTIYKFQSSDEMADQVLEDLKSVEWERSGTNFQTVRPKSLHRNEKFAKIHEWFKECLTLVKDEVQFSCEKMAITQSWGNLSTAGDWHHKHMHLNSMMSGVYYPVDTVAPIEFGVDSIWNYDKLTGGIIKLNFSHEDTTSIVHRHIPRKGELLIFPSVLNHGVPHNIGRERYSLSFNSFADGMLGSPEWLSSIHFDIK